MFRFKHFDRALPDFSLFSDPSMFLIFYLIGPPKSVHKYGVSSTTPSKGRTSASPLPSTPEQPLASASPFGPGSLSKGHVSVEDIIPTHAMSKEKTTSSDKETPNMVTTAAVLDKTARKVNLDAKPTDLRSMLISLLMENPKGMSLKVSTVGITTFVFKCCCKWILHRRKG